MFTKRLSLSFFFLVLVSSFVAQKVFATPVLSTDLPIMIGTNYAHFGVNNCSVDNQGIIKEYGNPVVRVTVQNQLAQMRMDGVQTLRFILWYTTDIGSHRWGIVPSRGGQLVEPYRTNLQNFLTDVKNAGYLRLSVSFGPEWTNNPNGTEGPGKYDPAKFDENWNFIKDVRGILKSYGPGDTKIDLWNEGVPSIHQGSSYQQTRDHIKNLYRNYVNEFGNSDVTVSYIGPIGSGGAADRLQNFIDLVLETGVELPRWFEVHIYTGDENQAYNDLKSAEEVLQRNGLGQPIVVGETYYNDEGTARGISRFVQESPVLVEEVMHWPNERNSACGSWSATPPLNVDTLASYLQTGSISCSPVLMNLNQGELGTATIRASWKNLSGGNPGTEVCVSTDGEAQTLFASGGGVSGEFSSNATWIQPGKVHTFTLYDSGSGARTNCSGKILNQCSVTALVPTPSPATSLTPVSYFVSWEAPDWTRGTPVGLSGSISSDQMVTLDQTLSDSQEGTKILYARFFYSDGSYRDAQQSIIYRAPIIESPSPSPVSSPTTEPSPSPEPSPFPSPVLSPSPIPSPSPSPSPSQNPSPSPSPSPSVEPFPSPVPSPSPQTLLGDINGDGELSIDDYNILVRHFGPRMPVGGSPADLNHDNEVSIDDYNLFVRYFSVR